MTSRTVRRLVQAGLAVVIGFLALVPIASVANRMGWPFLNGWALAHGTFLIVVPVVSVIVCGALALALRVRRGNSRTELF